MRLFFAIMPPDGVVSALAGAQTALASLGSAARCETLRALPLAPR